jgi:hypothetical protein
MSWGDVLLGDDDESQASASMGGGLAEGQPCEVEGCTGTVVDGSEVSVGTPGQPTCNNCGTTH